MQDTLISNHIIWFFKGSSPDWNRNKSLWTSSSDTSLNRNKNHFNVKGKDGNDKVNAATRELLEERRQNRRKQGFCWQLIGLSNCILIKIRLTVFKQYCVSVLLLIFDCVFFVLRYTWSINKLFAFSLQNSFSLNVVF